MMLNHNVNTKAFPIILFMIMMIGMVFAASDSSGNYRVMIRKDKVFGKLCAYDPVNIQFKLTATVDGLCNVVITRENGAPIYAELRKVRETNSSKGLKVQLISRKGYLGGEIKDRYYLRPNPDFPWDFEHFLRDADKRRVNMPYLGRCFVSPSLRPLYTKDFNDQPRFIEQPNGRKLVKGWPAKYSHYSTSNSKGIDGMDQDPAHCDNIGTLLCLDDARKQCDWLKELTEEQIVWGMNGPSLDDILQSENGPAQSKYGKNLGYQLGTCVHESVLASLTYTPGGRQSLHRLLSQKEIGGKLQWVVTLNLPTEKIEVQVDLAIRDIKINVNRRTMHLRRKWKVATAYVGVWSELILQGVAKYLGGHEKVPFANARFLMFLYTGCPTLSYSINNYNKGKIPSPQVLQEHLKRGRAITWGYNNHCRSLKSIELEKGKWVLTSFCPFNREKKGRMSKFTYFKEDGHWVFKVPHEKLLETPGLLGEFSVCYLDDQRTCTTYETRNYGASEIWKLTPRNDTQIRVGVTQEVYRASVIHTSRNFRGLAITDEYSKSFEALSLGSEAGAFDYESPIGFTNQIQLERGKTYYLLPFKSDVDRHKHLAAELLMFHDGSVTMEKIPMSKGDPVPICFPFEAGTPIRPVFTPGMDVRTLMTPQQQALVDETINASSALTVRYSGKTSYI